MNMKNKLQDWETIFVNYLADKGPIPIISKELRTQQLKNEIHLENGQQR